MTAAELQARRKQVETELAEGHRHLLAILKDPEVAMRSAPVGDVLCWAEGLTEERVSRILSASEIQWGRRLSLLSARDVAMLCFQIKARHSETWERWRETLTEKRAAA